MKEVQKKQSDLRKSATDWIKVAAVWLFDEDAKFFRAYRDERGLNNAGAMRALTKLGIEAESRRENAGGKVKQKEETGEEMALSRAA